MDLEQVDEFLVECNKSGAKSEAISWLRDLRTTLTTQQSEINRLSELVSHHDEVTAQWSKELQEKDEQISALESRHIEYLTGKCTCPKKDNAHPKAVHWPGCPMILLEEIERLRELVMVYAGAVDDRDMEILRTKRYPHKHITANRDAAEAALAQSTELDATRNKDGE